jgi:hypothetical protein
LGVAILLNEAVDPVKFGYPWALELVVEISLFRKPLPLSLIGPGFGPTAALPFPDAFVPGS